MFVIGAHPRGEHRVAVHLSMSESPQAEAGRKRKPVLLRLDPAVHEALARCAADDLRSVNAQVEVLLRQALAAAGRAPRRAGALPKRGRPSNSGSA